MTIDDRWLSLICSHCNDQWTKLRSSSHFPPAATASVRRRTWLTAWTSRSALDFVGGKIRGSPQIGVSRNGRYPNSWMVLDMENPMKIEDDWGYPNLSAYFRKPPNQHMLHWYALQRLSKTIARACRWTYHTWSTACMLSLASGIAVAIICSKIDSLIVDSAKNPSSQSHFFVGW